MDAGMLSQAVSINLLTKYCNQTILQKSPSWRGKGRKGYGSGGAEQKQAGSVSLQALIDIGLLLCLILSFFSLTNLLGMAFICPNPGGLVIVNSFTCC